MIFIASVSTLIFNANPLMRFDGYYIMMDLLEVPNLQAKSRALIQHQLNRMLFGPSNKEGVLARMPLPKKRFWLFYAYAILVGLRILHHLQSDHFHEASPRAARPGRSRQLVFRARADLMGRHFRSSAFLKVSSSPVRIGRAADVCAGSSGSAWSRSAFSGWRALFRSS